MSPAWSGLIVAGLFSAVVFPGVGGSAQRAIEVFCSPPSPIVLVPGTVRVRAWADPDNRKNLEFRWSATSGKIATSGAEVDWAISDAAQEPAAPYYQATVRAIGSDGAMGICEIRLWPDGGGRGPAEREAGRTLLKAGEHPPADYGLYSYLLLGSEPLPADAHGQQRYIRTLEAWWALVPDLIQLEKYVKDRNEINAMFLPISKPIAGKVSADLLLEYYDYTRARALLRAIGRTGSRDGPYLVSSPRPLDETASGSGPFLFQDLSSVPPTLAAAWTKEFLNQTAQRQFWKERTVPMFGLRMRTTVRVLGEGLDQLISWNADPPRER
jgi:hypothetical protein